jgi:hypothetical protein
MFKQMKRGLTSERAEKVAAVGLEAACFITDPFSLGLFSIKRSCFSKHDDYLNISSLIAA